MVSQLTWTHIPDLQEEATKTVLAKAERLCADWENN